MIDIFFVSKMSIFNNRTKKTSYIYTPLLQHTFTKRSFTLRTKTHKAKCKFKYKLHKFYIFI